MASWSEWFKESARLDFNLRAIMPLDLPRDLNRLYSSGLPVLEREVIDGKDLSHEKVKAFCTRHRSNWIRIYHKSQKDKRFYKLGLDSDGVLNFIAELGIPVTEYNIQLFEYEINKFGGNVVSDNQRVAIDIIRGKQELVNKGSRRFYHGSLSFTGCLGFDEKRVPRPVRIAAGSVLRYLRKGRGEYIPGYFEFIVSPLNQVYFLDYKTLFLQPSFDKKKPISGD